MQNIGGIFLIGAWLLVGLMQIAATMAGLEHAGLPFLLRGLVGWSIAGLPVVGTALGIWGAIYGWGWSVWEACLLFFGTPLLFVAITAAATIFEGFISRRRSTSEPELDRPTDIA